LPFTSALDPPIWRISLTSVDIRVSISPTLQQQSADHPRTLLRFARDPHLSFIRRIVSVAPMNLL
jgi:hypothetical protein